MFSRLTKLTAFSFALLVLFLLAMNPSSSHAQCSDEDYVAVFVLSGLDPDYAPLQIEIMSVSQVGPNTYPPESEILQNVWDAFGYQVTAYQMPSELIGNMWSWTGSGGDISSQALVDQRDGSVLFAGKIVWMGTGYIYRPTSSSHPWELLTGDLAPEPISVGTFVNWYWEGTQLTSEQLTSMAVELLRTTDVIHSFGDCGDYSVTGWVHTPTVGGLDTWSASLIITVEGKIGPPWNGQVPVSTQSWGSVKAMFR